MVIYTRELLSFYDSRFVLIASIAALPPTAILTWFPCAKKVKVVHGKRRFIVYIKDERGIKDICFPTHRLYGRRMSVRRIKNILRAVYKHREPIKLVFMGVRKGEKPR